MPLFSTMRLISLLLLICSTIVSSSLIQIPLTPKPEETITLGFDNISCPTKDAPFCRISRSSHLDFYSWTAFDSVSAANNSLVTATDADCAISSPNALFSWRSQTPRLWPRIVLNSSTAASHGLDNYFDFTGLAMKPMNFTPRFTRLYIQAYGVDFNVTSSTFMPHRIIRQYSLLTANIRAGPQVQHYIDINRFFPNWGKGVNMVEIFGIDPDGVDVPVCIDDLRVRFHEAGYYAGEVVGRFEGVGHEGEQYEWKDVELYGGTMKMSAWSSWV